MTPKGPLRQWDERFLPVAAASLRRWVGRAEVRREHVRELADRWDLAALDDRYAGRAPFVLLRRQPLVGLAVAAALLVAGVGVAVVREGEGSKGPSSSTELLPQGDAPRGTLLGPQVGDRSRDYVRDASKALVDAVRDTPDAQRVALVSLTDYKTPEQVRALLAGFTVRRAFLRARAAGKQATALPIDVRGDLLTALRAAYSETAKSRLAAQKSYQGYVDTLRPDSTQDRAFRDLYAAFARSSGIEAREYGHNCACVYSVLVTSTPTLLLSLNARPGVRAVEVAGPGIAFSQVQAQPLMPEVDGVVPRPSIGGIG